jgi:hypothetical protein
MGMHVYLIADSADGITAGLGSSSERTAISSEADVPVMQGLVGAGTRGPLPLQRLRRAVPNARSALPHFGWREIRRATVAKFSRREHISFESREFWNKITSRCGPTMRFNTDFRNSLAFGVPAYSERRLHHDAP